MLLFKIIQLRAFTLSYNSAYEIPSLLYNLSLKTVILSSETSLYRLLKGVPFRGFSLRVKCLEILSGAEETMRMIQWLIGSLVV